MAFVRGRYIDGRGAISIPDLMHPICDAITKDETILNAVFADQLLKLIIEPLQSLPDSDSSMVVVIDGLDECDDYIEVAQLIAQLADPLSNPHLPLRFLVTSRPEPPIRAIFEHPGINCMTLRINLQDFSPNDDILSFLERRLRDIPRVRSGVMFEISQPWPSNDDLAALVEKSAGLFIYASTLAMFIDDKGFLPQQRLEMVLADDASLISCGHSDLDRLYTQILSVSSNVDHFMVVIGAIILVRTPLSPRGLSHLLEIEFRSLQLVLERLHSILSIPEDPETGVVTPFHLSLHDFLVTHDRAGHYFIDPSLTHAQLARSCLKRISTLPRFTFPTFRNPMHSWVAIAEHIQQADKVNRITTQYACHYWSSHIPELSRKSFVHDMKDFCRHFVFSWRFFMEIEAQENNIMQSPENQEILRRAREGVRAQQRRFTRASKITLFAVILAGIASVVSVLVVLGRPKPGALATHAVIGLSIGVVCVAGLCLVCIVIIMGITPIQLAMNAPHWGSHSTHRDVETSVLETRLSINEMPFLWRCMFYRALTPRVARMLKRTTLVQEGAGDITNATLESGV
ncbi:hypothetical protein PILCRDRAFT_378357 [Piloderma croceum F 1598]|uniref:Nephrocystin 3-like N-terminal domain-containing protein n=1 Tax=Piloderma croceum (strain F 1598) TaxID=765440 RepID=A0A0C3FLQ2_PILCF|nr:hypothetical protein PILCRDRAFT_378357 [Piloderma croceum F 1598]